MREHTYTVYEGRLRGKLVYIGTTVQPPADRFRWHRANGKDLEFTVLSTHPSALAMLREERRLIELHRPQLNKRVKQNLNVKLTPEQLAGRRGDPTWCQACLKRRVNKGYTKCFYC